MVPIPVTAGKDRFDGGTLVLSLLVVLILSSRLPAQDDFNADRAAAGEIDLQSLPEPPERIANLIRDADVSFKTGRRTSVDKRLQGLTEHQIQYHYRSRTRWTISRDRRLMIRVRFHSIQWKPSHKVWLRRVPHDDSFWSDPLIRHELDHVRISSDSRLQDRFEQHLRETRLLVHSLSAGEHVDQAMVDRLVRQRVAEIFRELTDLIDIRYRELDRLTRQGRQPVPEDSEVTRWLRSGAEESRAGDASRRE